MRRGPKVYGTMSLEVLEQRCEAELNCLRKTLRANRKIPAAPQWASIVAWELARAAD
jgi:hypothetical protein